MFIVEIRDTQSDPAGSYPLKLVFVREVIAGKIFEVRPKDNPKPAAIFVEQPTAAEAARKTIEGLNGNWRGVKEFAFQVIPVDHLGH